MGSTTKEKKKFKISRCLDKSVIEHLHKIIFSADDYPDEESVDWVVTDSCGKYVGFCMLSERDKTTGHLNRAGVLDNCQGYGLHLRMIRARERFAASAGFEKLITYTKIHNIQSSANLQKCGYRLYAPEKPYADKDCIYWIKHLKPGKKKV